jgi:hypothetical protein
MEDPRNAIEDILREYVLYGDYETTVAKILAIIAKTALVPS